MIGRYAAVLALLAFSFNAQAQSGAGFGFQYQPVAKVVQGTDTLRHAWVGGLNTPQFSSIDLNADGQADLLAFDRQSSRCYTFLNVAASGGGRRWQYAPDYETLFPADLYSWVLLRDYDCDGRPDIFTADVNSGTHIRVLRNTAGPGGRPTFTVANAGITFSGNFPGISDLLTDGYSMPDIKDVNGDGKLDIVSYYFNGSTQIELYLNTSPGPCGGALTYTLTTGYWGGVQACGACTGFRTQTMRRPCAAFKGAHTPGHTVCVLDLDGDGDMDLLDGRDNCAELTRLLNVGTVQTARFDSVGTNISSRWPTAAAPAQAGIFPGAYNLDVNFDGRPDLVVAPDAFDNRSDLVTMRNTVKVLANTSASTAPAFAAPVGFLQPDMIDVSEGAAPAFGDLDGDGDLDMLVGNKADAVGGEYRASLTFYRNVGTRTRPIFQLVSDDYLGLSSRGLSPNRFVNLRPQLADLNRDGALDLVFSVYNNGANFIYYIINTAAAGQAVAFNPASAIFFKGRGVAGAGGAGILPYFEGDSPCFTDIDGDGYVDMLIGTDETREAGASLRYFRQLPGVRLDTAFALVDSDYGRIRDANGARPRSLSPTLADFDGDRLLDLLTVDASGILTLYSNFKAQGSIFASRTDLVFNALTNTYADSRLGTGLVRFAVAGADVTGDGAPELFVGLESGGILSYTTRNRPATPTATRATSGQALALTVYPNPAATTATVETATPTRLSLLDLTGRVLRRPAASARQHTLAVAGLPAGLYLVRAEAADGSSAVQRLEVQ